MSRETELYRLELEAAAEVFGRDTFLSINQIAKRTNTSWESVRRLFAGQEIPAVGVSKARYALALSQSCTTYVRPPRTSHAHSSKKTKKVRL